MGLTIFAILVSATRLVAVLARPTCIRDIGAEDAGVFDQIAPSRPDKARHECLRPCNSTSGPMTCEYTFDVEWYYTMSKACYDCPCELSDCEREDCVTADGVPRAIVAANRRLPGTPIEVCKGDRVIVKVVNQMNNGESLSVHWHGIYQKNTPYMDGISMLTQCPIIPFTTFRYDFAADHAGTHWWHGHTGLHRSDGLFGALVVRQSDEENPHINMYDHDLPEHKVLLNDWEHRTSPDVFADAHFANGGENPASILINGRAQLAVYQPDDTSSNTSHVTPRELFGVKKGFKYRFRVISSGVANIPIRVSVDNHTLTLIASDGSDVEPLTVESLVIFGGERYDFVLSASQEIGNYWLRAKGVRSKLLGLAIIRYQGANLSNPEIDPYDLMPANGVEYQKWNTPPSADVVPVDQLVALENATLPQEGKRTVYLAYDFSTLDDPRFAPGVINPQVNDRSFTFTNYPLLSQFDDDLDAGDICEVDNETYNQRCDQEFCLCTQVIQVDLDQTLEIVLIDESKAFNVLHPFHLHGHAFRILAQGKVGNRTTREEIIRMDREGLIKRNFDNPPEKDTVATPAAGYTVLQFVADNPGWWFLHCHIEFHLETGMALVIRVGDQSDRPPVPRNFPRCGDFSDTTTDDPLPGPGTVVVILAVLLALALLVAFLQCICLIRHCKCSSIKKPEIDLKDRT